MSQPPARTRRPIEQPQPETPPSIRRFYWYGGAALGVLAGALLALFAIPPLFDRYFGVADVALGHEYHGDVAELAVLSAEAELDPAGRPDRFIIVLDVRRADSWCPAATDFRLELEGNVSLGGATIDPLPECGGEASAPTGPMTVAFDARGHGANAMHILHLAEPEVRFWLKPGEPGE